MDWIRCYRISFAANGAAALTDREMQEVLRQASKGPVFVCHHNGLSLHVLLDLLRRRRLVVLNDMCCAKLAVALLEPEHNILPRTVLLAAFSVPRMSVLFLPANERRVALNRSFERRIER